MPAMRAIARLYKNYDYVRNIAQIVTQLEI